MSSLRIKGPATLKGELQVGGSKNAAPKELAACLLATESVTLHNVPDIKDVQSMLEILRVFGMKIDGLAGTVRLDPTHLRQAAVPDELASRLRSAAVVMGPAVARFGKVSLLHPGGDVIGKRPLDIHFKGLSALGVRIKRDDLRYHLSAKKLRGTEIFLEESSVTATENVIMAATLAEGTTVIHNAASELHVADLAAMLNSMGARIIGAGTNLVTVEGVSKLGGTEHRVRADEIEAGTFMIAAALTGGQVRLTGIDPKNFGMILVKLREAGVNMVVEDNAITVSGPHRLRCTNLKTETWPGFPTDLQPPFTVLMTQAKGMSLIHDHMYEGRFFYTDKMTAMGANIIMADPHRIIVFGPTALVGRHLESPDIRAGITLVIAGLVAQGTTVIDHVEHIDRGYEKIDERLRKLGADVVRLEEA